MKYMLLIYIDPKAGPEALFPPSTTTEAVGEEIGSSSIKSTLACHNQTRYPRLTRTPTIAAIGTRKEKRGTVTRDRVRTLSPGPKYEAGEAWSQGWFLSSGLS